MTLDPCFTRTGAQGETISQRGACLEFGRARLAIGECAAGEQVMRWKAIRFITAAILGAAVAGTAAAQQFPTRPVTLIVPWSAGGPSDIALRSLATATEKHLGQALVLENRPGASATLGPMQMAASARPGGYTIAQITLPVFRYPFLTKTIADPGKDFTYILGLSGYTLGVAVRSDAPWKTFQ